MDRTFTKHLIFLAILLLNITGAFAQTITVGTVDPGPYGQGSSIAVPINVNTSGGCVNSGNTYNLYLSDASGNFSPGTLIGSYTGVYGTFVNGVIPNGTPAGAGYKVEVKSTNPAVTSSVSSAFTISSNPGVTASLTESETVSAGVFGRCVGSTSPYTFTSSAGGTVTASFFNEGSQSYEASNVSVPAGGYAFTPTTANYTVTGKSVNASGTVGTYDYQLVNNVVVNPFSPFGTPFVCMPAGGSGDLQFIMPITGPGGIINNYPGTTYTVNWGDGTSTTFTYCQIVALGGILVHTYTLPSCGQTSTGGATNSLTVVSHAISPYCGEVASAATTSAKVIITPVTKFNAPSVACVGTALTIPNTSDPGPDYSTGAASTCAVNANAKYDWTLDGVAVAGYQGVPLSKSFIFPATTTHGTHTLTLHAETPAIGCASTDYTQTICFENPPQPVFTMPTPLCVTGGPVSPTNTSTVDNTCAVPQYVWTVTGPAPVGYAGGTNANSAIPQFVFSAAGFYTVQLGISSSGCGVINAAPQTIAVDAAPTTSMSPNATICGSNLTFTFDPSQTTTKTVVSGTTLPTPTTFSWVISGGAYSFLNGTTPTSQYPQILFADFATYTIKVTNTNSCGSSSASQTLTFVQAPTVSAGGDQTVCASNPAVTLAGTVTGSYTSYQWVGGTGTFSPNRSTANATYTPSNTEITAGTVTLTFQVNNTAVPAPCNVVTDNMKITITPTAYITSPPTDAVCSGQALTYLITANSPLATFAWTASLTSGTATGFTASGTNPNITDVLTNSGNTDAVVTYNILPTINGCPGTPFVLNVTVHPLPTITAVPVNNPICNNQPADIVFTSNVVNTTYTWTSTASANISGNTNQAAPLVTTSIQDVLSNSGTTPGTVTYTVTPYNGTCPGTPVVTTITVEPTPIASNAGPDDEVCATTTYTLQGNNPAPGTGKWTAVGNPPGVAFNDDTNPNAVVSGLVPGNIYQFTWTITDYPSCPSTSSTVSITIDKSPIGGTTGTDAHVCSGSNAGTITLTGQFGSVVRWESSIDNGTTWQPIANTATGQTYSNLTQTTQYRAFIHNGVCPDVPSSVTTITVDAPPVTANAGSDDEVCATTTYTLQGNNPSPGTGKWTVVGSPAGVTFSDDTDPNAVVNGLVPGTTYQFIWAITNTAASCPPTTSTVAITIDKAPVGGTTLSDAHVCLGTNAGNITLTGQFGTIIRWESSIDNGTSWQAIANTTTIQPYTNLTQTTQYRAVIHNGVCPDATSSITTITVDQPPIASVAGPDDEVCSGGTYTLQGNNPAPGTGKWTVAGNPPGVIFSDDTNPNAVVSGMTPGNTYKFTWTISNTAACPSTSSSVNITIDKGPVGGTTLSDTHVCSGTNNGVVTLTGQFGTILHWESSIDNGATWQTIANITTSQSYLNLTQTTQYRAILHNSSTCPDATSTVTTITVDPPPTASNPGPNDEVCNANTYTLQGNNPSPSTGKWTMVSGPVTPTFSDDTNPNAVLTGLVPGTYVFRWTITNTTACPPSANNVTIIIDKAPIGGTTSSDATVCSGTNGGPITLTGQFGTIVRWESSIDNGTTWQPIFNTSVTLNYSNLTQTTKYRAFLHNGVCPDVPSSITTITVDQPPIAAVAGPDNEVCNSATYTLQGNNPAPGTGTWTMVSGPSTATFSNATSPNATATGLVPGVYVFRWTITNTAACPPTHDDVTITIDPSPVGGTTSSDATVCAGTNAGLITLTGQFGTIVRWESSIDNGASWQTIANTTANYVYSNLTQTTQYRVWLHNGICPDVPSSVTTITVDQPPIAAIAGPNDEVCSPSAYTLQGNNPAPNSGKWTMVSGPSTAIFSDDTKANAVITGLVPGVYVFRWTISNTAACAPTHDDVTITIDQTPVGGTTTSDAIVCAGSNGAPITLTGQFGSIVRWESSTDGGSTWQIIANTSTTLTYSNLTQTTKYRAWLHNGVCPDVPSSVTTITVDQPPIAAIAGPNQEICSTNTYTLQGNNPAPNTGKWTMVSGPSTAIFSDDTKANAVVTGLVPGVYVFQWTISNTAACPSTHDNVTITIDPAPVGGTTSSDATVCQGSNAGPITLAGQSGNIVRWEYSIDNGASWQPIASTSTSITYTNLTQTTQYRAMIHNGVCPDVPSTVTTITVDAPPIAANAGPDDEVCNATVYTLKGNTPPAPNKGQWSMVTGPSLPTFTDPTDPNTVVTGLMPGTYTFRWSITNTAACPPTHDDVVITIDKAPVGGTTSSDQTVCSGGNSGQIHLAGQFGSVARWEFSIDNGSTWQPIANTTTVLSFSNLTQTTQYRAWVHNGITCPDMVSTPTTITVNPQTPIAYAGPNYNLCNETSTILKGNNPGSFVGVWTQTGGPTANIADPNNYTTSVTGLTGGNVYKFTWTIKGLPPCGDTFSEITIGVSSDITPSFAMDQDHGCGPVVVTFTNTSTPTPTGTFVWNFGDGSPQVTAINPPAHTFQPSNDGTVAVYEVTMIPTSNCGSQAPYVAYVKVSAPKPVASFNPGQTSACGTFTLSAQNLSPGDNAQYDFYLKDANGNIVQHLTYPDTRDAVFQPMTVTQQTYYSMYLVVIDKCGNQATSPSVNIPVSPSSLISKIQIKGDANNVCIGSPVTFQNTSTGGDRFTVTIYDSNKKPILTMPAGTGDINYTPTATGAYYVSITAGNTGCGDAPESALVPFTVYPIPAPSFTWTADQNFNVTFNNTTPDVANIPAASLNYKWDFGDGSTIDPSYIPATHHFDFSKAPFTVTLTATTPGTDCAGVTQQTINITFKGNLFLPNAFIPASSDKNLNTFIAKGFGMKTWHMQIFNNFGQLVWETTKLDTNGAPVEGWDGTYKGRIVEQGVYIWQISATLLNGEEWKGMSYHNSSPSKTGAIHLIR
ncbi:MAG TPA: PKD-like domain-containing protein [Mucilaginibacter sp.]